MVFIGATTPYYAVVYVGKIDVIMSSVSFLLHMDMNYSYHVHKKTDCPPLVRATDWLVLPSINAILRVDVSSTLKQLLYAMQIPHASCLSE